MTAKDRKIYTDKIADRINAYRQVNNGKYPSCVFISSALFDALTDKKGNKRKSKFGVVKVKVYKDDNLEFYLSEERQKTGREMKK